MTNYDIKSGAESIWFSVQLAAAAVTGWCLLAYTDMDALAVMPIASAVGSAARPVLGYLIRFLPKPAP